MQHKVAVYGTLREGEGNWQWALQDRATKLGDCLSNKEFTMHSLGGFPGVVFGGNTAIKLEVFKVEDHVMQDLDHLEGYPDFYNRVEIDTPYGKAWMYFLESCSGPEVESGDWLEHNNR